VCRHNVCHNALLSIKGLAIAIFHQSAWSLLKMTCSYKNKAVADLEEVPRVPWNYSFKVKLEKVCQWEGHCCQKFALSQLPKKLN